MSTTQLSQNSVPVAPINPLPVQLVAAFTPSNLLMVTPIVAPATVAAQVIKATNGKLYMLDIGNSGASDVWVKVFNVAAGSVVLGTTVPLLNLYVPKGTRQVFNVSDIGDYYSAAISCATTGAIANLDSTAITASTVSINARFV